jgi:hypothetical protein
MKSGKENSSKTRALIPGNSSLTMSSNNYTYNTEGIVDSY